jgi:hypothetical protein
MPDAGERLAGFSRYARTGIPGGFKIKLFPDYPHPRYQQDPARIGAIPIMSMVEKTRIFRERKTLLHQKRYVSTLMPKRADQTISPGRVKINGRACCLDRKVFLSCLNRQNRHLHDSCSS